MSIKVLILFLVSLFFLNCGSKQQGNDLSSKNTGGNITTQTESTQKTTKPGIKSIKEEIVIKASDDIDVSANFFYEESRKDSKEPLVVLVHQFMQTKEQWQQSFVDSLIAQGYKVIAYDIRGHGKSSKVSFDLSKLLEDSEQAPKDIAGVFEWAKKQLGIDSSRIAAIGTSIGGNLACYASFKLGAKTCIAISNGKETFLKFIGYDERMMGRFVIPKSKSIFFICGSKDGEHEKGQRYIMDNFVDDPKDIKAFDSDKHGKALIEEHPEIYALAINWLKKNL